MGRGGARRAEGRVESCRSAGATGGGTRTETVKGDEGGTGERVSLEEGPRTGHSRIYTFIP